MSEEGGPGVAGAGEAADSGSPVEKIVEVAGRGVTPLAEAAMRDAKWIRSSIDEVSGVSDVLRRKTEEAVDAMARRLIRENREALAEAVCRRAGRYAFAFSPKTERAVVARVLELVDEILSEAARG